MSKTRIAEFFQEEFGASIAASQQATRTLIDLIIRELKDNGTFPIPTIGTLYVLRLKARKSMNPKTGEKIKVKARKTVRLRSSVGLRCKV